MTRTGPRPVNPQTAFFILLIFVAAVALMGGGSRPDVTSLIVLRPVSVVLTFVALACVAPEDITSRRSLALFVAATVLLTIFHLVPLPPAIWTILPGRQIIAEIDKTADLGNVWRPISLVPTQTWNSLFALFAPIGALLLAIRLPIGRRWQIANAVLIVGLSSALLGLFQAIASGVSQLYLYRITNEGAAVGLFANRNHQAALLACVLPMLALWASRGNEPANKLRLRAILALGTGMVVVPLILVTGSRAGLLLGLIAIAGAIATFRQPSAGKSREGRQPIDWRIVAGSVALVVTVAATLVFNRAEAVDRLLQVDALDDLRWPIWKVTWQQVQEFFPVGSGIGTFVEVFRIHEPYELLRPQYVNHAHNDLLETAMAAGLPGIVLMLVILLLVAKAAYRVWRAPLATDDSARNEQLLARASSICLLIMALASLPDYPLRTPMLMTFAALWLLWLHDGARSLRLRAG